MKTLRYWLNRPINTGMSAGAIFVCLGLATSLVTLPAEIAEAQWFRCASGTLQTQGNPPNRARCWSRVQPDAGCPLGTVFQQDHAGNTDFCLPATGTIGGNPFASQCGPGQQVDRRSGRDRCYVSTPVNTSN